MADIELVKTVLKIRTMLISIKVVMLALLIKTAVKMR